MAHIVPNDPKWIRDAEKVCLATASERARTDEVHRAFTLAMYCDGYLAHERAYILVEDSADAGEHAIGYVLFTEDFDGWVARSVKEHEEIAALGGMYPARLAREVAMYERFKSEYPAHLHIDIAPGHTGGGWGGCLLETMAEHLASAGVPGVMLGVSADNERAIAFYQRHGFEVLEENEFSLTMGRKL